MYDVCVLAVVTVFMCIVRAFMSVVRCVTGYLSSYVSELCIIFNVPYLSGVRVMQKRLCKNAFESKMSGYRYPVSLCVYETCTIWCQEVCGTPVFLGTIHIQGHNSWTPLYAGHQQLLRPKCHHFISLSVSLFY